MGKETDDGWTVETAKAYLIALIEANDHRYEEHFRAQREQVASGFEAVREAVSKAESATERRFDSVNEFRAQLGDQAATFLPRSEAEARLRGLNENIEGVRTTVERSAFVTREFFDRFAKEQAEQHTRIFDQLSVTYTDISNMKGRSAAYVVAIGVFFTIVTIASSVLARVIH